MAVWNPPKMQGSREMLSLITKTPKQLHWAFQTLDAATEFAFDIETTHATSNQLEYYQNPVDAKILGISFSWAVNKGLFIPIYKNGNGEPYFRDPATHHMICKWVKYLLEKPGVKKIAQNGKFDAVYLYYNFGVRVRDFEFDTMVAHWVINENGEHENWAGVRVGYNHGLELIAEEYLGHEALCTREWHILQQEVALRDPKFHRYETLSLDMLGKYGVADAIDTYKVYKYESQILEARNQTDFFLNHEMAKTNLLIMAEIEGIAVHTDKIPLAVSHLDNELARMRQELAAIVGFDFDPAHAGNTAYVLFDTLKLTPIGPKGKSDGYSTKKAVLEKLALQHEVPSKIVAYRNASRLKTNYIEVLHKSIDPKKNVFHMSYKQIGTDTGRLSAPIIQSMPSDAKGGKIVKEVFWAGEGNVFIFSDFSQIELRVMAEMSRDANMIAAFQAGEDIHTATAKRMLGVTDEWINDPKNAVEFKDVRRQAKTINFGILFGEGAQKLSDSLGFAEKAAKLAEARGVPLNKDQAKRAGMQEAKDLIESYFRAYPGVKDKIEAIYREAELTGQVRNIFGRIRHLEDIVELASVEMPRYHEMLLSQEERNVMSGRSIHKSPPDCYRGQMADGGIFPPTLSGHLGFDMVQLVAGRKPPKLDAIRAKFNGLQNSHIFARAEAQYNCLECPFIASCAWDSELNRRKMKLQRMRRQAFSSFIQGTAVDMCMDSMKRIQIRIEQERIPAFGTSSGLAVQVLQVHDEIGTKVAKSHAEQMSRIVQEEMERWPNEQFPDWVTPIKADPSDPVESWADKK